MPKTQEKDELYKKNTRQGRVIVCFKKFGKKKNSWPFSSFNPISSSFLVCFEWFKTWWLSAPTKVLQKFFVF